MINELLTHNDWESILNSSGFYMPTFGISSIRENCYYKGQLVVFDGDFVWLIAECSYCRTSPFIRDRYYPKTCARCGAPII